MTNVRLWLHLNWTKDGPDRFVRQGEVIADLGDWGKGPSERAMQRATYAAKMALLDEMGGELLTPVKGMAIHRWYSGAGSACKTCGRKRRPPQGVCRWPVRRRTSQERGKE